MANIVAIQQKRMGTSTMKNRIDFIGDRTLARPAQTREPDHTTAVPVMQFSGTSTDGLVVPNHVWNCVVHRESALCGGY